MAADGIQNKQPRLVLDQQLDTQIQKEGVTKKVINQLLGLAGVFRRDSIQASGKQAPKLDVEETQKKGSYPYNPYETCQKAEDYSKFKVGTSISKLEKADKVEQTETNSQKEEVLTASEEAEATESVKTPEEAIPIKPLEPSLPIGETEESEEPEKVKEPTDNVNKSIVKEEMDRLFDELSKELTKEGETNFSKLEELIRRYVMLAARNAGITDEQFRQSLANSLKIEQKEVVNAVGGSMSIAALSVDLTGSLVTAGLGGLGSGIQSARGLASSADMLGKFGNMGQLGGSVSKFMQNSSETKRTEHNYYVDNINQKMQQSIESRRQDDQNQQQLKQAIDEWIRNQHQIFSSIASTTAA